MEHFDRTEPVRFYPERSTAGSRSVAERKRHVRTPATHRLLDAVTEGLIYFLIVFTPWAFGTTQPWSIWTMNIGCYLLGAVFLAKWYVRWQTGYRPSHWGMRSRGSELLDDRPDYRGTRIATWAMAILTFVTLAYCLTSALNPRAVFSEQIRRFEYFDPIKWLPHSYDQANTWKAFWSYLALAFFFWAVRDWVLSKTSGERRASEEHRTGEREETEERSRSPMFPARLRRVLWVLCISGAVLALEGILQRLDGTGKLLWLVQPRLNQTAESQFGPYSYRSNAATYLNLVWPVCLGFWLGLRKAELRQRRIPGRVGSGNFVVLLPCAVLMAGAPIISTSRGGALIAFGSIIAATAIVFFASRREAAWIRAGILSLFLFILGFSAYLGWDDLARRLETMFVDKMSNRVEIYDNAGPIAREFPVFGTGPGSFAAIYYLYREQNQEWAAYLHDDWMETRITFGWVGFSLILSMLGIVAVKWFIPGGIRVPWDFVALIALALGGALLHAKFDFPFQVHSILLLFVLLCSLLFSFARSER